MALTRITKGVIKPNENYDTHNIVSTGIVTSIGLDVNGNADISGSLSVGGVLTYEDVTSIDSIGIITARTGLVSPYADIDDFVSVGSNIHLGNAGVITATSFVGSGAALTGIDATAIKDSGGNVKIQAQASGAMHTGIHTFSSGAEVGSNIKLGNAGVITATTFKGDGDFVELDVDGHTNLDNVNVAGVTTFASTVNAGTINATLFSGASQIGIQSAGTQIGAGITQLNFVGTGNTFAVNGTTVDISIAGGGGAGAGGTWSTYTAGIATSKSVGVNTTNLDDTDLTGIGNSFKGLYISNGMIVHDNVLNGNHYIGTSMNGLMAGPVTIDGNLEIDGNYVVV